MTMSNLEAKQQKANPIFDEKMHDVRGRRGTPAAAR